MGFIRISKAREEIINYSRQHYYWLIKEGKIKGFKDPDKRNAPIMIDEESLLEYLESIRVPLPE